MNYQEAEAYIYSLSNLSSQSQIKSIGQCKINLEKIEYFLSLLGSPHNKIPHYIHITGTSGKGSVVSFIREIIKSSGEKVGSISSPHPSYIYERWTFDGKTMSPKEFVSIVLDVKPAIDKFLESGKYEMLTFFEICQAIGFLYLAQKKAKWAVVEVGCGGRFDSSNVIPHKDLAIITNIGLDHTEILGDTKEKIAFEKAGIIKNNCLVFTGEKNKKCLEIIEKECYKFNLNLNAVNDNYKIVKTGIDGSAFEYRNNIYTIGQIGEHQIKNAILSIESMRALGFNDKIIKRGLEKAFHPLNLEIVEKEPIVILDSAHNEDKIKSTINSIKKVFGDRRVDLVLGFSANKNISKMINKILELNLAKVAISRNTVNHFRKVADPLIIKNQIEKRNRKIELKIFSDPWDAFSWIKEKNKNNLKMVTGSVFLSGEIRAQLKKEEQKRTTFRK